MCRQDDGKHNLCKPKYWITAIVILLTAVIIIGAIIGDIPLRSKQEEKDLKDTEIREEKEFVERIQKYVRTQSDYRDYLKQFNNFKTFAQTETCTEIGRTILNKNGSAVDAGIAMIFCQGVMEPYNSGLGGGFLMLIYIHKYRKVVTLNARETVTSSTTANMLKECDRKGWPSVAIPGEGLGLWEAHKRYGKLPWDILLEPSINLASNGFPIGETMLHFLNLYKTRTNTNLLEIFINPTTKTFYKEGENYVNLKLSELLKDISTRGMYSFYFGEIADKIEKESLSFGGVINKRDFQEYRVKWSNTLTTILKDSKKDPVTFHIPPLPSCAIMILNIVQTLYEKNNFNSEMSRTENELFYHQVVESMKQTFAEKEMLKEGFPPSKYVLDIDKFLSNHWNLQNSDNPGIKEIFEMNSSNIYGSTNVAALASNGDAIVSCNSLNDPFGSDVVTHGFVLNNNMLSFSNWLNQTGCNITELISDKKRSATYHSPIMVLDEKNELKLILAAYGDSKVITSISLILINYFFANKTLKESVRKPRYHQGFNSDVLIYEGPTLNNDLENLAKYGHAVQMTNATAWPWVLVISCENAEILTISDPRRVHKNTLLL